jgi:hypothetical protein
MLSCKLLPGNRDMVQQILPWMYCLPACRGKRKLCKVPLPAGVSSNLLDTAQLEHVQLIAKDTQTRQGKSAPVGQTYVQSSGSAAYLAVEN